MADDNQEKYLKIWLIKSTYKILLGRPADPDGPENYYHATSDKPLAESTQLLNASLINSDEFKGLTTSRMAFENMCLPPHCVSGTETQERLAVKHIVSPGSHCLTSRTLKKFNLKTPLCLLTGFFPAPRWSSIAWRTIFTHRDPSNRLGVLRPGSKEVQEHIKKRGWQAFCHLLQRRDQSCKGAPGISRRTCSAYDELLSVSFFTAETPSPSAGEHRVRG